MHAALDINIPNYASAVVTTNEIVASISSLQAVAAVLYLGRRTHK
jgi:ureidoacrylate peracid hydrolase